MKKHSKKTDTNKLQINSLSNSQEKSKPKFTKKRLIIVISGFLIIALIIVLLNITGIFKKDNTSKTSSNSDSSKTESQNSSSETESQNDSSDENNSNTNNESNENKNNSDKSNDKENNKTNGKSASLDKKLCSKDEDVVFSFETTKNKTLSICVAKKDSEYIIYRYGKPENVEFEYPQDTKKSWESFTFYDANSFQNSYTNYLIFNNGNTRYSIFEKYNRFRKGYDIGIKVNYPNKKTESIDGKIENKTGTLFGLPSILNKLQVANYKKNKWFHLP